jgi:hypothetical protein
MTRWLSFLTGWPSGSWRLALAPICMEMRLLPALRASSCQFVAVKLRGTVAMVGFFKIVLQGLAPALVQE